MQLALCACAALTNLRATNTSTCADGMRRSCMLANRFCADKRTNDGLAHSCFAIADAGLPRLVADSPSCDARRACADLRRLRTRAPGAAHLFEGLALTRWRCRAP